MFVTMVYMLSESVSENLLQLSKQSLCSVYNKESIFMTGICFGCSANVMSYTNNKKPVCASNPTAHTVAQLYFSAE